MTPESRVLRASAVGLVMAASWVGVTAERPPAVVDVQLLAINDFHGNLEPPSGSNGRIGQTLAGGAEFMAAHLAALKTTNPNTVIVSAGDNIGATPLISSLFHDEPSIESLNAAGMQISAVGNHELDEGWWELRRIAKGGCHPTDGCQDGTPYDGARFEFLAANITLDPRKVAPKVLKASGWKGKRNQPGPLFPASTVMKIGGVKIGFIGLTLEGAPQIVMPSALTGLAFHPEAAAANAEAEVLRRKGVRTIVVLIHEGGVPGDNDPNGCRDFTGPIVPIVEAMSDDIDIVVSGHTHRSYVCTIAGKLVTSAESYSRLVTDIDLQIDRRTGRVVSKRARNVAATRDVPPQADQTRIIEHYRPFSAKVGGRQVGSLAASLDRRDNPAGETALGEMVADAMLDASSEPARGGAQVALANPGGVRADLMHPMDTAAGVAAPVTYADAASVLPFGNITVVMTLTGDALVRLLEEQFDRVPGRWTMLQVSKGFSYAFNPSKPAGEWIDRASVTINGRPVLATDRVRVASLDFVWNGGDRFTVVKEATDPVTTGEALEQFVAYLGRHSPVSPGPRGRVRRLP
ncbi:MAG: bifunctional metallophosphatase/5'-nucleotidase [Vicinamibacterales bacterium]